MNKIYLGKIVNTHGIKGEIRIASDFDRKDLVFKPDFPIYIGQNLNKEIIKTYRIHKNYDMITLVGINDINDVLKYKGLKVYINRDDLELNNSYILNDLIGCHIIADGKDYGVVDEYYSQKNNILLHIAFTKDYYIPYNDSYIKEVNIKNKEIKVQNVKDLIL